MSQILDMLIGKRLTPEEQVKKWRSSVRQNERELDRILRNIDKEQLKTKKVIKDAAKRNDTNSCRILAKEIVSSNKQKERIFTSKAQLNSLIMGMQQQLAVTKVTGALQKSTETMKIVNRLMRIPELTANMREMSMEMMKAGVIEEMIQDTFEDETIEEEAEEEVEKVLFEITEGLLGQAGAVGSQLEGTKDLTRSSKGRNPNSGKTKCPQQCLIYSYPIF